MRNMTNSEIMLVNGAWGPSGAVVGGISGAAGYLGSAATSGQFSWAQLGVYTAGGAVQGAIAGPVGARTAYFAPRIAAATGAIAGRL